MLRVLILSMCELERSAHIEEEEVTELFGLTLNRNGYEYTFSKDEEIIKAMEQLYMICHQCTGLQHCVLSTRPRREVLCMSGRNART